MARGSVIGDARPPNRSAVRSAENRLTEIRLLSKASSAFRDTVLSSEGIVWDPTEAEARNELQRGFSWGTARSSINAKAPDDLQGCSETELRAIVLKLTQEKAELMETVEKQDNVVADLHARLSESELQTDTQQSRREHGKRQINEGQNCIVELEDEAEKFLNSISDRDDLSEEQGRMIVDLRERLDAQHAHLQQLSREKEGQCEQLQKSRQEAEGLRSRLDALTDAATSRERPHLHAVAQRVALVIAQRRAETAEERSRKRLRSLQYLYDLWRREIREDILEMNPDRLLIMAEDTKKSKDDLVFEMHGFRMQIAKEREAAEHLCQSLSQKDRHLAGLRLALTLKRMVLKRHGENVNNQLAVAQEEAACLRKGLTLVLENARSLKKKRSSIKEQGSEDRLPRPSSRHSRSARRPSRSISRLPSQEFY